MTCNGPAVFQVCAYGPKDTPSLIAESGPIAVGVIPVKGYLKVTAPWFEWDYTGDRPIIAWDALCLNKNDAKRTLYFVFEIVIQLSPRN